MATQNDYYALFSVKAKAAVSVFVQEYEDRKREYGELRQSLKDETANLERLNQELEKLRGTQDMQLHTGADCQSFKQRLAGYQDKLDQYETDIAATRKLIATLEKAIPEKFKEMDSATSKLSVNLDNFIRANRQIADKAVNKHLSAAIEERRAFLDDFHRIYSEAGITFSIHDRALCPGMLSGSKIAELEAGLRHTEEMAQVMANMTVSNVQPKPQEPAGQPDTGQTQQTGGKSETFEQTINRAMKDEQEEQQPETINQQVD